MLLKKMDKIFKLLKEGSFDLNPNSPKELQPYQVQRNQRISFERLNAKKHKKNASSCFPSAL